MSHVDAIDRSALSAPDDAAWESFENQLLAYADAADAHAAQRQNRRLFVELIRRRHADRRSPLGRLLVAIRAAVRAIIPASRPFSRRPVRGSSPPPGRLITSHPILRNGPPGFALGTPSGVPARA